MSRISLAQANQIITAALTKAGELALKPLAVAVVDAGGHLIAFQRQDGASNGRLPIAVGKATGALFMGMSSRKIGVAAVERPTFFGALSPIAPTGLVPAAGGNIVVDADGLAIGAVGISGDNSDNDEVCTLAGIAAAGLQTQA